MAEAIAGADEGLTGAELALLLVRIATVYTDDLPRPAKATVTIIPFKKMVDALVGTSYLALASAYGALIQAGFPR
jgi:hypothetical protein